MNSVRCGQKQKETKIISLSQISGSYITEFALLYEAPGVGTPTQPTPIHTPYLSLTPQPCRPQRVFQEIPSLPVRKWLRSDQIWNISAVTQQRALTLLLTFTKKARQQRIRTRMASPKATFFATCSERCPRIRSTVEFLVG